MRTEARKTTTSLLLTTGSCGIPASACDYIIAFLAISPEAMSFSDDVAAFSAFIRTEVVAIELVLSEENKLGGE